MSVISLQSKNNGDSFSQIKVLPNANHINIKTLAFCCRNSQIGKDTGDPVDQLDCSTVENAKAFTNDKIAQSEYIGRL